MTTPSSDVLVRQLRAFPTAYRMGAHDTNVCLAAASRLETLEKERDTATSEEAE